MIAALCVLSMSLAAPAAVPLADDRTFQDGMKLFDELEFEQAAFRFEQAALDSERAPAERAQVFLWLGLSYANAGRFGLAKRALEKAFTEDPTLAVPPDQSPNVLEIVEQAKAAAAEKRAARDEPPTPPTPPPPGPAPPAASEGPPWLLITGGVVAGVGVASLGTCVVLAVLTSQALAIANDKDQYYEDAKTAQDQANAFVTGAIVTGILGGILVVGGGAGAAYAIIE